MASVRKRKWTHNGVEKEAWVVTYTGPNGRRSQKTFEKKKEADRFKLKIDGEVAEHGSVAPLSNGSVRELCDRFLRYQEQRMRDGRIGRMRYAFLGRVVDVNILPYLAERKIAELAADDIEDWYGRLCKERDMKPSTAKDRAKILSAIFTHATERKWIRTNVVTEALRRLRGVIYHPIRTFTRDELAKLLVAVEQRQKGQMPRSQQYIRSYVHLATFCGLRRGEIAGLQIENIDFDRRIIKVRTSLTDLNELKGPKTRAGVRDVPAPTHVIEMLEQWLVEHYTENDRGLLFHLPLRNGDKKTGATRSFYWHWCKVLKDAGLYEKGNVLHFHALRHFAASFWIENGLPLTEVAGLLGHGTFDMTLQVYAHPIVGGHQRQETMERLSRLLISGPVISATTERQELLTH